MNIKNTDKKGQLVIISGPSGSGKTTVCNRLLEGPGIQRSISYTTRAPREGEKQGVDYHFISKSEFTKLIEEEGLIEYEEYCGSMYGTPNAPIKEAIENGKVLIFTIDVRGKSRIKEKISNVTSIFLIPPDENTLEQRLRKRRTESEESIQKRLKQAKEEQKYKKDYDHCVINDQLDNTIEKVKKILNIS